MPFALFNVVTYISVTSPGVLQVLIYFPCFPIDHRTGRAHVSGPSAGGQQTPQVRPARPEWGSHQHHPNGQLPQGQMAGQRRQQQMWDALENLLVMAYY